MITWTIQVFLEDGSIWTGKVIAKTWSEAFKKAKKQASEFKIKKEKKEGR